MKYMLLIYSPENAWSPDEWKECVETSMGICQEMAAKGQFLAASPLHPVATGSTVRVRKGQRSITAGPFAETTEQLGGYYLIDVENLDEAIAIAGRLPPAKKGTVEIRPLFKLQGLPSERLTAELTVADSPLKQFMFLCYDDENAWRDAGPEAHHAAMLEAVALTHRIDARGHYLSASPLHPIATATSVRVRNGQRIVTDGPFAETSEVLGGYYLILAQNQTAAVEIAAEHSGARVGAVEVRQVFDATSLLNTAYHNEPHRESYQTSFHTTATPAEITDCLTRRITDWWTTAFTGKAMAVGDTFRVSFGSTYKVFQVEELIPEIRIVWCCTEAHLEVPGIQNASEWKGTSIHWNIVPAGDTATITLVHKGLTPELECFEVCSQGWKHFSTSLIALLDEQKGNPFTI